MLSNAQIRRLVDLALAEDLGKGDVTTDSLIPEKKTGVASILAQEKGIGSNIAFVEVLG